MNVFSKHSRQLEKRSLAFLLLALPLFAADPPQNLTLLVPGGAGGGWDLTARAMKDALESEGLAQVRIESSPGPGGSVGLAQLLSGHRDDEHTLLVGGLVMLSAAASNHLAISPLDATPIARLTGDYPLVVVPSSSPFRNMADLMNEIRRDSAAFPWAGGSSGSLYERLLGDLYESASLSRATVNYVPHGSGREVAEALLRGRARLGVSEAAEVEPFVARGELRPLAVAAPARLPGLDIPTLRESGFDVVSVNWRGVFAGPALSPFARDRLSALMATMVQTTSWKAALTQRRWTDLHLEASDFKKFVEIEQAQWSRPEPETRLPSPHPVGDTWWPWAIATGLLMLSAVPSYRQRRRTRAASLPTEAASPDPGAATESDPLSEPRLDPTATEKDEVTSAFEAWRLTTAERDIAKLMLQGLRYKQIAFERGTSERTVRQQAQVILRKAGLDGRADLAARFLGPLGQRSGLPRPSTAA